MNPGELIGRSIVFVIGLAGLAAFAGMLWVDIHPAFTFVTGVAGVGLVCAAVIWED